MQRSSSNANSSNTALIMLGGVRSSGILGGLQDDNDEGDDKDDGNNCTTWTTTTTTASSSIGNSSSSGQQQHLSYNDVQKSIYWKIFLNIGLERLEQDFLKSVQKRLIAPVHLMFPILALDENAAVGLPSKYDLQRFDETIRNEIKLSIGSPLWPNRSSWPWRSFVNAPPAILSTVTIWPVMTFPLRQHYSKIARLLPFCTRCTRT
jgi:hypothetical protein